MYTNVLQHCNCQSQDNFLTLNITLKIASKSITKLSHNILHPSNTTLGSLHLFYVNLIKKK